MADNGGVQGHAEHHMGELMAHNKVRRQRRVEGGSPISIHVRTTTTTYARLIVQSARAGLSVPRYLIESALRESAGGWSQREQRWWAERLDTVETRLVRIGTNINQISASFNATGEPPEALTAALAYFTATLEQHRQILAAIDPSDRSREPKS
ncbi:MobC family plasmid mobilization relaxosome protein [Kibdelosporangium philippinense]|uniref:MobC family plasmid mobilization relaxosome protein n=2 Tax=Kibdelosporangium philippinense TaxID=211113 RepID=A0ABS8ZVZ0_9PSEU|nr:MobC family plasmid mobilization relaxosome protein [Kibdelosporangium philippinense]MCE7010017.1 MobC family plasmid mobilization relaxosome protein [Kibdelosporangium philippinense]